MASGVYQEAWGLVEQIFIDLLDAPSLEIMEDCLKEARRRAKEYRKKLRKEMIEGYKDRANPGSDEAVKQGGLCPRMDNSYGKGCEWADGFVISGGCPIHDKEIKNGNTVK